MSEYSWPWSTVAAVGDGTTKLSEALSREFLALYFGVQNPAVEGVSKGVMNELAVTGTASPISIATGSGICYGLYKNDAVVTKAITTPAVGTTGFRVVLQTNWAGVGGALQASTRIAVVKSADGNAAIPALTQTFGVTWEISLATGTITTGGVIALTDARNFRKSTAVVGTNELVALAVTTAKIALLNITTALINDLAVTTGKIADLAVTAAKLAADAVTTVKVLDHNVTYPKIQQVTGPAVMGRSVVGAGDYGGIPATAGSGAVLRESANVIGFGTVSAAGLANDAVTTSKIAAGAVGLGKIDANAVTLANIEQIGGLAVLGRGNGTTGDVTELSAGSDNQVLRRSGLTVGFGTVATGGIADNAVDDTKAGNRVPQFYRRQGGSATDWSSNGNTTQTPTAVRIQAGAKVVAATPTKVTFPVAFSDKPLVFATATSSGTDLIATVANVTAADFDLYLWSGGGLATGSCNWIAYGPE